MDNDRDIEINIRELFQILLKKLWIIMLAGITFAAGAGLYSKLFIKPVYTSGTKIYVINRENKEITTYSDLQTGAQLTQDYKILVKSRPVTEQVLKDFNLDMTHEQLVSDISVNTPANTRILEIKVKSTDPLLAKKLADGIAEVSVERMMSVMETEKANIVEYGNIPLLPSSPDIAFNVIAGGICGTVLAVFVLLFLYITDDTVKNPDDVEKYLGITVLGNIPFELAKGGKGRRRQKTGYSHTYENAARNFAGTEAYKTLRTNIQFCGKEVKTICITSCTPDEGKTVISFRLASALAESGKKVLLIDADLRKSVIIGKTGIYGLSQYLSGMNGLEEVINKTNVDGVDIIFTGPIPPNPSELLGSEAFHELMRRQREIYDYILVDTPPLGIVIDSANAAEYCDGTVMVLETNKISRKMAERVLRQLEKGKCRVLGAVLNKVDLHSESCYGKGYTKYYGAYE